VWADGALAAGLGMIGCDATPGVSRETSSIANACPATSCTAAVSVPRKRSATQPRAKSFAKLSTRRSPVSSIGSASANQL
jgi:hypothetical protein